MQKSYIVQQKFNQGTFNKHLLQAVEVKGL